MEIEKYENEEDEEDSMNMLPKTVREKKRKRKVIAIPSYPW